MEPQECKTEYVLDMENRIASLTFDHIVELLRPCNIKKPRVFKDGDQWCALLGENLMEGVCGFGDTPELACVAFDKEWRGEKGVKRLTEVT
jgi:hypothetical protein